MSQERINSVERFKRLTRELQLEVAREAIAELDAAADELVEQMQAVVPVGKTGNLRKSIRKATTDRPTRVKILAGGPLTTKEFRKGAAFARDVVLGSGDTRGIAKGGSGRLKYDYSRAIEFGTKDQPAHPFFWPSWRLRRKRIKSRMRRKITATIKKRSAE